MRVITSNPVTYKNKRYADWGMYSNIDGTNKGQVLAFQKYANTQGSKLKEDGAWGSKTASAYTLFGSNWELTQAKPTGGTGTAVQYPVLPQNVSVTDPQGNKKAGQFWDKAKNVWVKADEMGAIDKVFGLFGLTKPAGETYPSQQTWTGETPGYTAPVVDPNAKKPMSKGLKIGLIVGGVVLLGTIIYFATRSKGATAPAK